tara:strand:+ start:791 stop:1666 length:876 start_codon:yes stop_codon:yes gene_type:complete
MKRKSDIIRNFIFENTDIRGEVVALSKTCNDILANHQYGASVERLLSEFICAATLLSTTIKFEGLLTLQARGTGEIPLIMAECSSEQKVRAIARGAEQASSNNFQTLLCNGQLAITIDPKNGKTYQGIVPLDGENLAECLESYFVHSEQLATRIWLAHKNGNCGGLLLQQLPKKIDQSPEHRANQWQHICQLAETIKPQELIELNVEELLFRLYHQEKVRIFEPKDVEFQCSCSWENSIAVLATLSHSELEELLEEQGEIEVNCEFCNYNYSFGATQISALIDGKQPTRFH